MAFIIIIDFVIIISFYITELKNNEVVFSEKFGNYFISLSYKIYENSPC